MESKTRMAVILALLLTLSLAALAQNKDQVAITADGKRVVLKSDGTWEYATATAASENPLTLPLTRKADMIEVTLLDVYKTKAFSIPSGIIGPLGRTFNTYSPKDGYDFVVVRFNVASLQAGQPVTADSKVVRLYDSGDNLSSQFDQGRSTDTWTELAFEVPTARQVKTVLIGRVSFDLTRVSIPSK